ncbi:MAG: nucleotide exchange factor GrpE [gamma proteobacterium symbiont of Taylorina sp.]|nr:nucleotide exchange factor GrpE [gamma proteobacterium symbiont of Taylorina sp.]
MSEEQKVDEQTAEGEIKQTAEEIVNEDEDSEEAVDELAALKAEELISRIKLAQAKADENWDVALRTKAEMENVRRRTEKEVSNARKFGVEKMVNEILPVKDSMELGLKAAIELDIEDEAVHKVREGMELTLKMMNNAMTKIGVKEVASEEGEAYSADFHQAMSMQEVAGKEANTIIAVVQKGYMLNDRLIRPAMVMVAK